jgi:hypothetical protein
LLVGDGPFTGAAQLVAAGVTDAGSFTRFYWAEQLATAGLLVGLTTAGGLGGAALYGVFRPRPGAGEPVPTTR